MTVVKEKAFAKINLYLDVTAKRDDGFHEIRTVMQTVSLCDDVTVILDSRRQGNDLHIVVEGNRRLPRDSRNIAFEAARLFLEQSAITAPITIKLKKRIPVAAGLAGGSSDAAAVLRGMNKLFKRPLSDRALLDIAARLGSDVPYCLFGGTALCEGRGEKMEALNSKRQLFTVIALSNGEYVSTPRAYSRLDEVFDNFSSGAEDSDGSYLAGALEFMAGGDYPELGLFNIFEKAVLPECPGAASIKEKMLSLGAYGALMSGSGPSVFGLFESAEAAKSAENTLREQGVRAYYAESVQ